MDAMRRPRSLMMEMKPLKAGTSRRQVAWLSVPAMLLLGTVSAEGQHMKPVAARPQRVVAERDGSTGVGIVSQSRTSSATAKGAGIGLLVGALAGVAVGAMVESGNEGGSPETRDRYKGFGYAIFVPVGAIVGAIVGGIIGARMH